MRILVISDVHANYEALRRLPDDVDGVLCLGDLMDYGPQPKPCLDWLRERNALAVRGNHDEAVVSRVSCRCSPAFRHLSEATRELMWRLLDEGDLAYLRACPVRRDVVLGGIRFHLVHATPSDPLYTYLRPSDRDRWEAEVERVDADVLLVGHTHLPMVMRVGRKLVVNPGSVGQPRDGDPRASFAVITDGEPSLQRVEYDVEASVQTLRQSGLAPEVVEPLAQVLRTG